MTRECCDHCSRPVPSRRRGTGFCTVRCAEEQAKRDKDASADEALAQAEGSPGPDYIWRPDPSDLRSQLRAAIKADPRSVAQVARDAGMDPTELSRLLREDKPRDAALSTWEQVARALGLRVALVPAVGP